ncbi:cytochrome-c peroxidase [Pseudovibrio brasiliensis]|uniref:Methylamine utilization protein MauG n=1 Tax=Pseudovibrio brasiliensis TaxID=1898042 RepID=A0ABX8ARI0_9HYPH|nr:cytochrome c peroxidase [Pseudovibrio brasiliensis]QUS57709.1 methylamine utilization protein MauG [Pseudovibrio brasiliensis]
MRRYSLSCIMLVFLISLSNATAKPSCEIDPESWSEAALQRSLSTPLGLPSIPHPADNPPTRAKIELGRKLFFDRRLSINRTMSCAMCHVPEQGFTNWELSTAIGVEGRSIKRNSPSILNVGYLSALFHDGRDPSLETQFISPLTARNEMANPSAGNVVSLLNSLPEYTPLFDAAFGAHASLDRIGMALGAYQRSVIAGNSPFDQWHYGGNEAAVSNAAKRGFEIFTGKGGCSGCHLIEEDYALFTDEQFHDTGYGQMRENERQNPPSSIPVQVAPGVVHQMDFSKVLSVSAKREADLGRYEVTEVPSDRWKFRTPTLRNLTITPPYMHDGHFSTLTDVVRFYDQGGSGLPGQDPRIHPLKLTGTERMDLEAFLRSLTSPDLDCLTTEARVEQPDNY